MFFVYLQCFICVYFVICVQCQNITEGSECVLDGHKGRCVEIKRCLSVVRVFEEKKKPQICSFKGATPIVCCTDCELVDDIDQIVIDPYLGSLKKDGRGKSRDYCLNSLKILPYECKKLYTYSIYKNWDKYSQCDDIWYPLKGASGGEDANRYEFPHMALLGFGEENDMQWLCGGTIINEQFILTAGHCTASSAYGPVAMAALGILKRSDPDDIWKKYKVIQIIAHPGYKSPSKYHDIALLKTATRIQFSMAILPACLKNSITLRNDFAVATGWGKVGPRAEEADTLQVVTLFKFTDEECSALYEPNRLLRNGYNSSTQACWGNKYNNQDTCSGDSGGPLHINTGCMFHIIGVTSYGRDCGQAGQAGMYTRVEHYVPWIESVVWP